MTTAERVLSRDGTEIAFERHGAGPTTILVAPALQGRAGGRPLAEHMASRHTVVCYDRRGRGDSGETPPYSIDREVEDLAAVIDAVGGRAALYGHSSGAALVLHAATRGLPIDKIVLHEPPFGPDTNEQRHAARAELEHLEKLLADDRRQDAVVFFLTSAGMPEEIVEQIRQDPALVANAPTLRYDPYVVLDERSRGGLSPAEQADSVTVPALVIAGRASPDWMIDSARGIAEALPRARFHLLDGHDHFVPPAALTPVLTGFLTE